MKGIKIFYLWRWDWTKSLHVKGFLGYMNQNLKHFGHNPTCNVLNNGFYIPAVPLTCSKDNKSHKALRPPEWSACHLAA